MPITLVATGGTIASTRGADGAVTASLDGTELLDQLPPDGDAIDEVNVVDLPVPGSWNMSGTHAARIAAAVGDALHGGSTGVVVTHGTDVLEETAFLAELLLRAATVHGPVVFTAAMRHSGEFGADGPRNLADALAVASHHDAAGRGSLVCLSGEIHHARWAVKTHATALCSFESPGRAPIGAVDDSGVRFVLAAPPPPPRPPERPSCDALVPIVPSHWDSDEELVPWHLGRGARGIVIEAGGAGNINRGLLRGVGEAIAADVPVVVASRCRGGAVTPVYGGAGGFATLAAHGAIGSNGLPAGKARLALQVALELDPSSEAVRQYFDALADAV
jgi:L-asparaginase